MRRRHPKKFEAPTCPFCDGPVPRPSPITGGGVPGSAAGGRCSCGAVFTVDVTGHSGGESLLEALALACGEYRKVSQLSIGHDYEIAMLPYNPRTHSVEKQRLPRKPYGICKLLFVKLTNPPE